MPFLAPAIAIIGGAITAVTGAVSTAAFIGGTLAFGVGAGETAATIATLVVPAVIEFGALAGASALLTPKPKVNTSGSPQAFKADPNAPIPVVMGRYGVGGNLVYETVSGGSNKAEHGAQGNEYLTHFTILSGNGPIEGVETLRFDDTILTFSGETCSGGYIPQVEVQAYNPGYKQNGDGSYANTVFANHAWQTLTYGGIPSPSFGPPTKLAADNGALTEWTGKGFSGFAASALTLVYDQTVYSGGVPQRQWVLKGVHRYDPRKDNNYPGGSGDQYWAGAGAAHDYLLTARSSWTFSENPAIHALDFALGDFLPDGVTGLGRHYLGIGAGGPGVAGLLGGVDVAAFVHAANVADANGWKICGQWTAADGKWSVLTAMLQAGGAVPLYDRGRISCMVSEPRTSLGTVTANDLAGDITLDTGTSRRERPNTVFYSYSSEAHRWQVVQADTPISPATYVAEDGEVRIGNPLTLEYVPSVNQAAQLTAYAIADGREIPNIQVIGKPHLRAYAVGDCFTLDIPEAGLSATKVVVTKRTTSISTGQVTLVCRTETDAKHAYALGRSGVAPPTPGISGIDPSIVPAPIPTAWTAAPTTLTDPTTGAITHVIRINGTTVDNLFAADVIVDYAPVTTVGGVDTLGTLQHQSFTASVEQIDLNLPAGRYHVWLRYRTATGAENPENQLDLGVITVAADTAASAVTAASAGSVGGRDAALLISDVDTAIGNASVALGAANDAHSLATTASGDASAALAAVTTEQTARQNGDVALGQEVTTVSARVDSKPNLITNPSFAQGTAGWTFSNGAYPAGSTGDPNGPYVVIGNPPDNVTSYYRLSEQLVYGIPVGGVCSLQAKLYADCIAAPTTFVRCVLVWLRADGSSISEYELQTNVRSNWAAFKADGQSDSRLTAPAGTDHAIVIVDIASSSGNIRTTGGAVAGTRVKLELSPVCTAFSDEKLAASVNVVAQALAQPGLAAATYGVNLIADAGTGRPIATGFKIVAADGSTGATSAFLILADDFEIKGSDGSSLTFSAVGGGYLTVNNLSVQNANIANLAVGTTKLAYGSAQQLGFAENRSVAAPSGGTISNAVNVGILAIGGPVDITFSVSGYIRNAGSSDITITLRLYVYGGAYRDYPVTIPAAYVQAVSAGAGNVGQPGTVTIYSLAVGPWTFTTQDNPPAAGQYYQVDVLGIPLNNVRINYASINIKAAR